VSTTPVSAPAISPGAAPHIMVILEENEEYGSVIGNRVAAPYFNSLADGGGLATAWYGVGHPSLPNYLALISGSTWGVTSDGAPILPGPTVVDQLASRGIGWRAYMEGMPTPCYSGIGGGDGYAKKHDPFMFFGTIVNNPAKCAQVVPFDRLAADLQSNTAPPFLWVTPNLCNDGHDCGVTAADTWLRSEMPVIQNSAWYRQGASVVITWDEGGSDASCCTGAGGGQIATIVVGRGPRRLTTQGDHFGTLRAVEEAYGLPLLGAAANPANGDLRPLIS